MAQLKRAQLQKRIRAERSRAGVGVGNDSAPLRRPGSVLLQPSMDATGIENPKLKDD